MPVSLTEWRVRIGRFIQNPPYINKQEMIQRFLERWKAKKEKTAASAPAAQDQTPCQSVKEDNLKTAASSLGTQDQTSCQSAQKDNLKTAPSTISAPSTQDQALCESANKEKAKRATSPSAQDQSPSQLTTKEKQKVATCPPSSQTPCTRTPSCTPETNLVRSSADTGPVVLSSVTQILLLLLTLMTTCFQWWRREYSSVITDQHDIPTEPAQPVKIKVFLSMSCFSSGLRFCRRMLSDSMGGFHLYLPLMLLMRSGDVETNPGPDTLESMISEMEFLKLARNIHPSYYTVLGVSLGIPYVHLEAILIEKLNNYPSAFMAVFMEWNVKQQPSNTNKREVFANKLQENDLGDLSAKLRTGCLLPESTGGPSRSPGSQTKPPPDESETKPLSPELIERCAKDFKFKYRSTLCKIRADPLNPASLVGFEKLYTNLVLQEDDGGSKQTLDYNDLCDLRVNGEFPKRLMVQGEAGAGKTTLCAKIAWDWIEGRHFSRFVWVLIVHLRDAKQYTLGQIAKSYLDENNPTTAFQLAEYIRSNPDKVFIAFDGFDEFSGKVISESECQQSQTPLQPSQSRADSSEACGSPPRTYDIGLENVLCSGQLASCPVLVTTRPWRAAEIRSNKDLMKLYTFLHVEGFSRENLSVYVHKYFRDNDHRARQLIQFTSDNDVISENMAHYPIYVAMLCLMWKELKEQKLKEIRSLQTFSQIFKIMICFLKEHYAQKKIKEVGTSSFIAYLEEIDAQLKPVANLAFIGLLNNTLTFTEDDFQICPESKDTACRVGILSQEDRITCSIDMHARNPHVKLPVFFPHKLFQEYMASVHLASLYESDPSEFSRLIGKLLGFRKEEYRYLLYFTVSQNKTIARCVMESLIQGYTKTLSSFGSPPKQDRDFIVDVAFESQDPHVAALVKDKVSSQGMRLDIDEKMKAHTVAGYTFTRLPVSELIVVRDCGPTTSLNVAEMIWSLPFLEGACLGTSFHSGFYAVLAQKGSKSQLQELSLQGIKCPTAASVRHLIEALCSMPKLTYLRLGTITLSDEFYSTLRAGASSLQVQTLIGEVKCPTPASGHHLAEVLCSMPNLKNLVLDEMVLSDEFCFTLKARASSFQVHTLCLGLLQCSTPASSHHLAEAVCSMPNLANLTLCGNISDEFCCTLSAKASSLKVHTLAIHCDESSTLASSHNLAEAMCSMPKLADLTLQKPPGEGNYELNEFYSALRAKASSIQGCFPEIRKGNFKFNGALQKDLKSFLHALAASQSPCSQADHPQQQPMGDVDSSYQVHPPRRTSDHPGQQPMDDVHSSYQVHPPRRTSIDCLIAVSVMVVLIAVFWQLFRID